jgi:hypothetical protein
LDKLAILAVRAGETADIAVLNHAPSFEHDDVVRPFHCRELMRDEDDGPSGHESLECFEDGGL